MKVLFINSVCGWGSTGRICARQAMQLRAEGHEVKIAYGRMDNVPDALRPMAVRIGNEWDMRLHGLATRLFDAHGFASRSATRSFLAWAEEYKPDLLWLHNLHGYYINVELLFAWIKSHPEMQVKWTLHDCWAFTGHCAHFSLAGCNQWERHCKRCVKKRGYPASLVFDRCRSNFERKRAAFTGVKNMTLITPSKWLAGLVQRGFLKDYPVEVVYNTINTEIFRPTPGDFREKHGLAGKFMVLGVSNVWDDSKGLGDYIRLAQRLDERFRIVLVGLTEAQLQTLPAGILGVARTADAAELAGIYSAADLFFNPTYEDNYPTVNLEAEACGTPVVSYDTGGCAETLRREDSTIIPQGDLEGFIRLLETRVEKGSGYVHAPAVQEAKTC